MRLRALAGGILLGTLACQRGPAATAPSLDDASFEALRASHHTVLSERTPSPNRFDNTPLDQRFEAVQYPSEGRRLRGWLVVPDTPGPHPGLVWLHGSFAASAAQLEPLGDTFPPPGFAVFIPTWRGENGNPGDFELLCGELDDAVAAVRWFAARDDVDPERIVALGHSAGGALAALLSLVPGLPLRETVSVGGIYVPETFGRWADSRSNAHLVRFDPDDPLETRRRTLGPNVQDMVRPHVAYVGQDDPWFHPNVRSVAAKASRLGKSFSTRIVAGDHMSSLPAAYSEYAVQLQALRSSPLP